MLKLKDASVIVDGLKFEMGFALGIADLAYSGEGQECVITAGLNGDHNPGSLHAKGYAVDLRTATLTDESKDRVLTQLSRLERYGFDVVPEKSGDTPMTTAEHTHVEFDPKGRKFWRVLGQP